MARNDIHNVNSRPKQKASLSRPVSNIFQKMACFYQDLEVWQPATYIFKLYLNVPSTVQLPTLLITCPIYPSTCRPVILSTTCTTFCLYYIWAICFIKMADTAIVEFHCYLCPCKTNSGVPSKPCMISTCSKKKNFFVAFPWVETSTGPGGFMICVLYDGNSRWLNRMWFYGEARNRTCDPWFTRHRFIPCTTADSHVWPQSVAQFMSVNWYDDSYKSVSFTIHTVSC